MIFKNREIIFKKDAIEVKVELNPGSVHMKERKEAIKDMIEFLAACKKEHSGLRCTLSVKLQ